VFSNARSKKTKQTCFLSCIVINVFMILSTFSASVTSLVTRQTRGIKIFEVAVTTQVSYSSQSLNRRSCMAVP